VRNDYRTGETVTLDGGLNPAHRLIPVFARSALVSNCTIGMSSFATKTQFLLISPAIHQEILVLS
jgi:hypothetical protein